MSVLVALALAVVLGAVGLALDGGRLFVTKTELQNAADACALAASQELVGAPSIAPEAFARAEAAGRALARRHRIGFQSAAIVDGQVTLQFAASLSAGASWLAADEAPGHARHVRCTVQRDGIAPWFMQVLGIGEQSVRAGATASLAPSQINCAIPIAACTRGSRTANPAFGIAPGTWLETRFNTGGGVTGSFNWVDYTPPAGGASEVAQLLRGAGQCGLNVTVPVGQPGQMGNSGAQAWNTRFGLYQRGSDDASKSPPDFSGYAYTPKNWPSQANAYSDFVFKRRSFTPYGISVTAGNTLTGLSLSPAYNPATTVSQHRDLGADRRVVVAPLVNCGDWSRSQISTIQAWACVFMLHPIGKVSDVVHLEFLGLADAAGSPCASSGLPGSVSSAGPRVPALVQ